MPEYECAVAKVHKRLYGLEQSSQPVCCGKPMVLVPGAPQPQAPVQPVVIADDVAQPLLTTAVATVPQKEKNWWQLWN
jgi:hypothetical protein